MLTTIIKRTQCRTFSRAYCSDGEFRLWFVHLRRISWIVLFGGCECGHLGHAVLAFMRFAKYIYPECGHSLVATLHGRTFTHICAYVFFHVCMKFASAAIAIIQMILEARRCCFLRDPDKSWRQRQNDCCVRK